jgi:hypothetical protein
LNVMLPESFPLSHTQGLADDATDAATAPAPYPLDCGMVKCPGGIDRGRAVEHAGRHAESP